MYRILVVDDEAKIRLLIRKYAEFEGHEVTEAENGMEAVRLFRRTPDAFDIVIMDVMMPELDGFSAVAEIKKIASPAVIMLSARGEEYDKIHGFELGVDDYVVKPFSPKELMMRVAAVMSRVQRTAIPKHELFRAEGLTIDFTGRIVTVDGVMDVMEAEATEDFERMAAMAPSEKPYLKTGAFTLARKRILWLLVLMISGMITGGILGRYEAAFAALPMLVTFIPMLTDTGGNAGSQSSTLIIRGMAVGGIRARDLPRVLWKELRVSLIVGVALSAVNYARLLLTYPGQAGMALTVALAMLATVVMAKTIGGMLPILAKALHADPAIMAAPLITTIVDALSLLIYFSLAQMLLGI